MAEHGPHRLLVRFLVGAHARTMKGLGKSRSQSCVQAATAAWVLAEELAWEAGSAPAGAERRSGEVRHARKPLPTRRRRRSE